MCFKTMRGRVKVVIANPTDETFSLRKITDAAKALVLVGVTLSAGE